jgi:carboxylesterase type B
MTLLFRENATKVIEWYKKNRGFGTDTDARVSISMVLTDYGFRCASERVAALVAMPASPASSPASSSAPAFVYRYSHSLSFGTKVVKAGLPSICGNHTCHSSDLIPVYGNTCGLGNFTADEVRLSCEMGSYWAAFGATGDPNMRAGGHVCAGASSTALQWPAFDGANTNDVLLETPQPAVESSNTDGLCAFWDTMGYSY